MCLAWWNESDWLGVGVTTLSTLPLIIISSGVKKWRESIHLSMWNYEIFWSFMIRSQMSMRTTGNPAMITVISTFRMFRSLWHEGRHGCQGCSYWVWCVWRMLWVIDTSVSTIPNFLLFTSCVCTSSTLNIWNVWFLRLFRGGCELNDGYITDYTAIRFILAPYTLRIRFLAS